MNHSKTSLEVLLEASAARHTHLCPRQVLGVRIGLAGAAALGLLTQRRDKRLLVILETDGCFADGVEIATGCSLGHRTLRVEDYGKVAATFVDTERGDALRVWPQTDIRQRAFDYAPRERRRYFAQLHAYQAMPEEELLHLQAVSLITPVENLVSQPGLRVNCELCGEEIINEREIVRDGMSLCAACAGPVYYRALNTETHALPAVLFATEIAAYSES